MKKKALIKKITGLFLLLLFPSVVYFVLTAGKHNIMQLEIYGPREISTGSDNRTERTDTIYHTIPAFKFVNQYGENITKKDMKGKITVVDFFFSTCQTICKDMAGQMMRVQDKFKEMDDFIILSHTVDPQNDTEEILAEYAERLKAQKGKWHFLTGDKAALYDLAIKGYFITAMEETAGEANLPAFIHSEKFVLIDKQGRIRGYYDGTDREEVSRLIDEIKVLKAAEFIPRKPKKQQDEY